jgi:hypothetical protein
MFNPSIIFKENIIKEDIIQENEDNNDIKCIKSVTLKKNKDGFGLAISHDKQNKLIIRGLNPNGVAYQV